MTPLLKHLVIGRGEIGSAIAKILECDSYDRGDGEFYLFSEVDGTNKHYDVIHVCFPFSESFVHDVSIYEKALNAELVIVHSTVPVGTCDPHKWIHSPCRGIHPHLEEGIRTFVKFFGGEWASAAAPFFRDKGIHTMITYTARETEALKLWDTAIYGWNILIEKAIKAYCEKNKLDFNVVYKLANLTYNEGYEKLGHPEFKKYILKDFPGPIGGHCIQENWELLDSPITEISKDLHKRITGL